MSNDRKAGFPANKANPQAPGEPGDAPGFENEQRPQSATQPDPAIAELRRLEGEVTQLKRQLQSQDDRLFARFEKRFVEDEGVLRRAAELEGWDENALNQKIAAARTKVLTTVPLSELRQLNEPSPQETDAVAQDMTVSTLATHAMQLRQYLAQLGLSEQDFGTQGIMPYVGKAPGTPEAREFMKKVGTLLTEKDELAAQAAQHLQREGFAQEVAEELEETGGLGGTTGNRGAGGSAAGLNAQRMIDQEMAKFRGTGRVAEALRVKRELQEKYRVGQ